MQDAINEFVENDSEAKELMERQKLINEISNSIVTIRQTQGLTQKELADIANAKQASISRLKKWNELNVF